jgi:hypothetical protein
VALGLTARSFTRSSPAAGARVGRCLQMIIYQDRLGAHIENTPQKGAGFVQPCAWWRRSDDGCDVDAVRFQVPVLFLSFTHVCPEPVLVKCSFLYINGAKRRYPFVPSLLLCFISDWNLQNFNVCTCCFCRNTVDAALLRLRWSELLERQGDRTPHATATADEFEGGEGGGTADFFVGMDMDGDGYVSLTELRSAFNSGGGSSTAAAGAGAGVATDAQLLEMMAAADMDGDGKLSPAEAQHAAEAARARSRGRND